MSLEVQMILEDHYRGLTDHIRGLRVHDHVCLAYSDREQQVTAIAHFIKTGLELGEKCVYVSDKTTSEFVLTILKNTGVDVDASMKSGAIAVSTPEQIYFRRGYFDPDDVINLGRTMIAETLQTGFKALRVACDMTWVKTHKIDLQTLLDYELRVSCLFNENMVSICQYNSNLFEKETLDTLLRNHPVSIDGGSITLNEVPRNDDVALPQVPARQFPLIQESA